MKRRRAEVEASESVLVEDSGSRCGKRPWIDVKPTKGSRRNAAARQCLAKRLNLALETNACEAEVEVLKSWPHRLAQRVGGDGNDFGRGDGQAGWSTKQGPDGECGLPQ